MPIVLPNANVQIEYTYLLLPMQKKTQVKLISQLFHFTRKIEQNFTIKNSW